MFFPGIDSGYNRTTVASRIPGIDAIKYHSFQSVAFSLFHGRLSIGTSAPGFDTLHSGCVSTHTLSLEIKTCILSRNALCGIA